MNHVLVVRTQGVCRVLGMYATKYSSVASRVALSNCMTMSAQRLPQLFVTRDWDCCVMGETRETK